MATRLYSERLVWPLGSSNAVAILCCMAVRTVDARVKKMKGGIV